MYLIQRGEDRPYRALVEGEGGYPPRITSMLPADVPTLAKGEWRYSDMLEAWIGHLLEPKEIQRLYEASIR